MSKQTLTNCYKQYKKAGGTLSEKEYRSICYLFNVTVASEIIDKGNNFKLPYSMGELCIYKNKMQYEKLHLDYKVWREQGIVSYHLNEHSDGWYAMLEWRKTGCKLKNRKDFEFKFTRNNNRQITKKMKTEGGHQIYKIGKGLKYAQI
jgi:hypothetical protein